MNSSSDTGAVTYGDLVLTVADATALVIGLEISEGPNRHGIMNVTVPAGEALKDYILYEGEGFATLAYRQGGTLHTLFQGIIMHLETEAVSDTYLVHITAKTSSCMMDFEAYQLALQDTAMTSHRLIHQILKIFPGSQVLLAIPEQPVDGITVLYQETVWEFLKRFASRYGACLFVDSCSQRVQLTVGLCNGEEPVDWNDFPYRVMRNLTPEEPDRPLGEVVSYQVDTYEILPPGTGISFHNQELYIGEVSRVLQDGLLVNRYTLYFEEGLRIQEYHNPLIAGVSINGVVTGVQRNRVNVRMAIDALSDYQSQYLFPYSSVAASADGNGWFCMPKSGDPVRIFFPVSDEREGYAIANMQGLPSPEKGAPMEDPNQKDITTPDGKTVTFLENGILMSVGESSSIILTNDGNAAIKTEGEIKLEATEEIEIKTDGDLTIEAGSEIQITSDRGSNLTITEEEITADGNKIYNN